MSGRADTALAQSVGARFCADGMSRRGGSRRACGCGIRWRTGGRKDKIRSCHCGIGGKDKRVQTMTVHFIGAGPGAPDLITVRGLKLIQSCPVCLYAGSLVPPEMVAEVPEGARVVDTSSLTLDEIIAEFETGARRRQGCGAGSFRRSVDIRRGSRADAAPRCFGHRL